MKYTVTDLFCGCGGFSLGFKNAGFQIKQAIEIDKIACAAFEKNLEMLQLYENNIETVCQMMLSDS